MGAMLSFSGIVTFKSADDVRAAAAAVPARPAAGRDRQPVPGPGALSGPAQPPGAGAGRRRRRGRGARRAAGSGRGSHVGQHRRGVPTARRAGRPEGRTERREKAGDAVPTADQRPADHPWAAPEPGPRTELRDRRQHRAAGRPPGRGRARATGCSRSDRGWARSPWPSSRPAPRSPRSRSTSGCSRCSRRWSAPRSGWCTAMPWPWTGPRCSDRTPDGCMVANLPYNIATPLVADLLDGVPAIERMVIMVQREVGERLVALPGNPQYGAVSVKVAYWAEASVVGYVPPTVFLPRPKVDSALVSIRRRPAPALDPATRRRRHALRAGEGRLRQAPQDAPAGAGGNGPARRLRGRGGQAGQPGREPRPARVGPAGRRAPRTPPGQAGHDDARPGQPRGRRRTREDGRPTVRRDGLDQDDADE